MKHLLHIPSGNIVTFYDYETPQQRVSLEQYESCTKYSETFIVESVLRGEFGDVFYAINNIPKKCLLNEYEVIEIL